MQPQSETVWRQATGKGAAPCLREQDGPPGANFFKVVDHDEDAPEGQPVPIVIPIGAEDSFEGVDLVKMKAIIWDEASRAKFGLPRYSRTR